MDRTTRNLPPLLAAVAAAGLFAAAPLAHAGPAAIVKENADGELNRSDVFAHLAGRPVQTADGETFTAGGLTATPTANDAIWSAGTYDITAVARFAGSSQRFGTFGAAGYTPLFDVSGYGFDVTGNARVTEAEPFQFWRDGDSTSRHLSLASDNADGRDHLLTYEIGGLPDSVARTWVLFWEDLDVMPGSKEAKHDKRSSSDYNDLVLLVREAPAECGPAPEAPAVVPLPAAVWPGLAAFGAVVTYARRRSRRLA